MTGPTERVANGEKATPPPTMTDIDAAEKGCAPETERRETGLSLFGRKPKQLLTPEDAPSEMSKRMPLAKPDMAKRTSSLNFMALATLDLKSHRSSLLCIAVRLGDSEMARLMMDELKRDDMLESVGFASQDPSGNGVLQISALNGHFNIARMLLERGININDVDRNHGTALQAAIYMGQDKICRLLLGWEDPNPTIKDDPISSGNNKINVDTKGGYFGCALQVAAYKADEALVGELVEVYKADVNISGGKYGTALQAAARTGQIGIVKHILTGSNVNCEGGKYGTALQAVARGRYRTRVLLPEISRGQVLKHLAETSPEVHVERAEDDTGDAQYMEVAKELFRAGAKMNGGRGILGNPINAAACSGSEDLLELMLDNFDNRSPEWKEDKSLVLTKALLSAISQAPENQETLAKLLVKHGARIDYKDSPILQNLPSLPLEAAATRNLLDVVKYLLVARDIAGNFADTFAESGIHGTALRAAIATSKTNRQEVAMCLIEEIAEQWGEKERSPENKSSEEEERRAYVYGPVTRKSDGQKLDWTLRDAKYGNLVQLATFSGLKETVSLLLKYGADPNVRDTSQRTALHIAAWSGFPQIVKILLDNKIKANVNAKDEWGDTPLDQAEEALDRDDQGTAEQDLQEIIQTLRSAMDRIDKVEIGKQGVEFRGPKKIKAPAHAQSEGAKPVFTMPFWIPGVGFQATIVDVWECDEQELLLLKKPRIEDILYSSPKRLLDEAEKNTNKVNWIHIPTNNMTWAEMIISRLLDKKGLPPYKSIWGSDPFYTSPDLSPHARFIAPQCGRLVHDGSSLQEDQKQARNLFMAMPYIHWESYGAQKQVGKWIKEVKEERLKANPARNKPPLRPSERAADSHIRHTSATATLEKTSTMENIGRNGSILDRPENEEDYHELLRRYLYKRRPVHLRRTLDQYYYSHLADTDFRDGDQVVMRQFSEDKKNLKLQADRGYMDLLDLKDELDKEEKRLSSHAKPEIKEFQSDKSSTERPLSIWQYLIKNLSASERRKKLKEVEEALRKVDQEEYHDDNSPVLMIDQLWLWMIDEKTIVTAFPHRQYDRNAEDLDAADKTDILKTIVSYLHSSHRPEINTADEFAALIINQCVGILHKAEMSTELDFIKNYSVQSNKWADQVMQMLSNFVKDFEEFMIWIKKQPAESEESIHWFESIFSVTEQTQLLRNIQDMKDELGMLEAVFDDQILVLNRAGDLIEQSNYHCMHGCHTDVAAALKVGGCPHSSKAFLDQSEKHLKHIKRMQIQADQAYDTLKDLLNLKQQQAYVLEARVSRNQAISSGEQSKTIMVFTIVTIIFLPLTFVTTIFTLPIAEFPRIVEPPGSDFPPTPFIKGSFIRTYLIGITFAVAVPLILAAFEIQSVHNGWKKLRLKMAENQKLAKLRKKPENDYMPLFLRGQTKQKVKNVRNYR